MAGKANRKHGRCKRSPAMAAYKAESRDLKNAKRRAVKQAKRLALDVSRRARRLKLRKQGALRRIDARILAASESARPALLAIKAKVAAALARVQP